MRVIVIRKYVDKNDHKTHELSEVLDYPKERAEELIKDGAVEKYKAVTVNKDSIS